MGFARARPLMGRQPLKSVPSLLGSSRKEIRGWSERNVNALPGKTVWIFQWESRLKISDASTVYKIDTIAVNGNQK